MVKLIAIDDFIDKVRVDLKIVFFVIKKSFKSILYFFFCRWLSPAPYTRKKRKSIQDIFGE